MNNEKLLDIINISDGNDVQFKYSDKELLNSEELNMQYSTKDIIYILSKNNLIDKLIFYENKIINDGINKDLKIHGQRHIKNVLLYSILLGNLLKIDSHNLELLSVAAVYHDSGRITEGYVEHALASALYARKCLKDTYNDTEIASICTMIEFHEIPRNASEDIFLDIAKKNGVLDSDINKVRILSEVLKDADALDRTRFIDGARTNPKYLKFNYSKLLIKFAASIQETYALVDLKKYDEDESVSILLEEFSPQFLLRNIRHTVGGDYDDFAKSFLKKLASEKFNENRHKK